MATQTPNIGLILPIGTENVSREVINTNWETIDTSFGDMSTLTTDEKTNLVDAMNEVKAEVDTNTEAITTLQGNRAKIKTYDLNSGASTTISGVQNGILAVTRGATGLYGLFWGSGTNTLSGGTNLVVSLSNSTLTITNNSGMTCVCILIYN